ncbi:MAG: glycosyltransferase family 2 protein [Phormidesmis sp. CAN_BIN36]|nr:glycosyltransferase family 2 protein [Phormidesmis sp. CAN_BIN36]
MPIVSVIIPAYNAEKTILATLRSVQKQTLSDIELIVIDDGSTDRTVEITNTLQDSRVKVFSYKNSGISVARNRGIQQAIVDFISFIDADDLWTLDKLQLQLEALQKTPDAGVAYSWTTFVDEKGNVLYKQEPVFHEGNVYPQLLVENFILNGSNGLIRRRFVESVGVFHAPLKYVEDWEFYIRSPTLCTFVLVPKHQVIYLRSSQSATSKVDVMEKEVVSQIARTFQTVSPEFQPLKNRSLANANRHFAQQYLSYELTDQAVDQAGQKLKKAIQLEPQTLLDKHTQRLALKLLLMWLLPYKFVA